MKTILTCCSALALLAGADLAAQQTPSRRVLFTAKKHEILEPAEHLLNFRPDGDRYALLLRDTLNGKRSLIFNGKRIPLNRDCWSLEELGYINIQEPDGYLILDRNEKGHFVNRGGKIEGPFEYAFRNPEDRTTRTYHYILADRVYDNIEGRRQFSEGVFYLGNIDADRPDDYYIAKDSRLQAFPLPGVVEVKGSHYAYLGTSYSRHSNILHIDGRTLESYVPVSSFAMNAQGNYAYFRSDSHTVELIRDGERIASFEKNSYVNTQLCLNDDGEMAYSFGSDLYFPDTTVNMAKGFYLRELAFADRNNYAYHYDDWTQNRELLQIVASGKRHPVRQIPGYLISFRINRNGNYIYAIRSDGNTYVITDRGEYGPFDGYVEIDLSDSGAYSFSALSDGRQMTFQATAAGKVTATEALPEAVSLSCSLEKNGHHFLSAPNYDYVVIDGMRFGSAPALECRYDRERNAFVWYSLEGHELAFYEYVLD